MSSQERHDSEGNFSDSYLHQLSFSLKLVKLLARMLVPKFCSSRHGVFRWSMVTVTVRVGVCVLTPSLPGMLYEPNMVEEQMSSTSYLPKEFRNTLARDGLPVFVNRHCANQRNNRC